MPTISDSDLIGDITIDSLKTTPIGPVSNSEKITDCSATDHSDSPGESEALARQPRAVASASIGAAHLLAHLVHRPRAEVVEEHGPQALPVPLVLGDAAADLAARRADADRQLTGAGDHRGHRPAADLGPVGQDQTLVPELPDREGIPGRRGLHELASLGQRGLPVGPDARPRQQLRQRPADLGDVLLDVKFDMPVMSDVHECQKLLARHRRSHRGGAEDAEYLSVFSVLSDSAVRFRPAPETAALPQIAG